MLLLEQNISQCFFTRYLFLPFFNSDLLLLFIVKEMVLDKENDKVHPRYLAYDIIVFQVSCLYLLFHDLGAKLYTDILKCYYLLLKFNYTRKTSVLITHKQIFSDISISSLPLHITLREEGIMLSTCWLQTFKELVNLIAIYKICSTLHVILKKICCQISPCIISGILR